MTTAASHRYAGLAGSFLQRHGDEDEEEAAQQRIGGLLSGWKRAMGERDGVMSREDGSDLREDELRLPTLQVSERSGATKDDPLTLVTPSQQADHAILVYHNLMRGLDSMIVSDDRSEMRLHLSAEFVMIRALIEAAGTALWVLGPNSSDERVLRSLRLRYTELTFSRKLAVTYADLAALRPGANANQLVAETTVKESLEAQEAFVDGQMEDLIKMASHAGIDRTKVTKAVSPSKIASDAGAYVPELGQAISYWYWSTASSVAHSEPSNIQTLADARFIGVDVRDRPIAHFEPSAVAIWNHLQAAHSMIEQAHQLWNQRAAAPKPTSPPTAS
ncbi:hypothetical protein ACFWZW_14250 [Microbacterium enclense]|uniref:hypothetical protein n=1 Tax=Microbacterium enclense TaxID=993073 RepID=UPI0036D7F007